MNLNTTFHSMQWKVQFSSSYREVYISGISHYMSVVYAFVCLSSVNKYHYVKLNYVYKISLLTNIHFCNVFIIFIIYIYVHVHFNKSHIIQISS